MAVVDGGNCVKLELKVLLEVKPSLVEKASGDDSLDSRKSFQYSIIHGHTSATGATVELTHEELPLRRLAFNK